MKGSCDIWLRRDEARGWVVVGLHWSSAPKVVETRHGGPFGDDGGAAGQAVAAAAATGGRALQPRPGAPRREVPALQLAGAQGCGPHDGARDAGDEGDDARERIACRE